MNKHTPSHRVKVVVINCWIDVDGLLRVAKQEEKYKTTGLC